MGFRLGRIQVCSRDMAVRFGTRAEFRQRLGRGWSWEWAGTKIGAGVGPGLNIRFELEWDRQRD
jgi:hypothetical protein